MQFGTFISDLATKAGIAADDKNLKDLQAANLIIPDEVASKISESLFNLDSAKQNSTLKGYFHSQALSIPDKTIEDLISDFDDATKTEFKNEKNTPEKIRMLRKKVEAKYQALLEETKKGSGKDADKVDKLNDEIKKLNGQLADKETTWQNKVKEVEQKSLNDKLDYQIKNFLASKKYANEKQSQDLNIEFANLVLQKELAEKKAKIFFDSNGKIVLKQSEHPELDYFENHKPIPFGEFADKSLAKHNLLFVTDTSRVSNGQTFIPNGNGKTVDASALVNANSATIAQLETASAQ